MRGRSGHDPTMNSTSRTISHPNFHPPVRRPYFSCFGDPFCLEKHNILCSKKKGPKSHCTCHLKWHSDSNVTKHCAKGHTKISPTSAGDFYCLRFVNARNLDISQLNFLWFCFFFRLTEMWKVWRGVFELNQLKTSDLKVNWTIQYLKPKLKTLNTRSREFRYT